MARSFLSCAVVLLICTPVAAMQAGTWEELGGSASGGGISNDPNSSLHAAVALDAAGNPYVAWQQATGNSGEIYLKKWNGSAWVELAGSATGVGISDSLNQALISPGACAVAIDPSGDPVVAWAQGVFLGLIGAEVYLKRYDSATDQWIELDSSASGTGMSNSGGFAGGRPGLAIDANGNPVVAYKALGTNGVIQVFVKRWNGQSWVGIAGSNLANGISDSTVEVGEPHLALDASGNPVVTWTRGVVFTGEVLLKKFDGTAWVELGGSATGGGVSNLQSWVTKPQVMLDAAGNPIVTYSEMLSPTAQVLVKRWDGANWVELDGSGAPPGVSATNGESWGPSIGMGVNGPIVAWTELSNAEVYAREWNGSAWTELNGSASGPGISSTGMANISHMAVDSVGNATVAWVDLTGGVNQIYVKRYNSGTLPSGTGGGSTGGGGTGAPPPAPGRSSSGGGGGCSATTTAGGSILWILVLAVFIGVPFRRGR